MSYRIHDGKWHYCACTQVHWNEWNAILCSGRASLDQQTCFECSVSFRKEVEDSYTSIFKKPQYIIYQETRSQITQSKMCEFTGTSRWWIINPVTTVMHHSFWRGNCAAITSRPTPPPPPALSAPSAFNDPYYESAGLVGKGERKRKKAGVSVCSAPIRFLPGCILNEEGPRQTQTHTHTQT